jgi:DNA-binding NtrC family response regulator
MGERSRESKPIRLLLVDDDAPLREDMRDYFQRSGYETSDCGSAQEALELTDRQQFDVLILDMVLPGMSGLELLDRLKSRGLDSEIVMLTGEGTIETAVEAMKKGAREFLTKPIRLKELERLVQKAHAAGQLLKENLQLKEALKQHQRPPQIIGQSAAMQEVFRLIERTAGSDKPILIQGESGTGKELVARALHRSSPRHDRPLVVINCAALPETLLESELFGHEKGAFTGAVSAKPGLFEVADGGTLLIDEIGELAGPLQAKLLRVLEDGSLRRLGSVKERHVRVRLLAATNREMAAEVEAKRFREDLYYRINVLTINLPPLREREGDIKLLAEFFAGDEWNLQPQALEAMERYSWPGNVRQLQNAIERAKILAEDDWIRLENLPPEITQQPHDAPLAQSADKCDLESLNKLHIAETYRRHQGNKARTARALGIGRRTLYRLLEKYGIGDGSKEDSANF